MKKKYVAVTLLVLVFGLVLTGLSTLSFFQTVDAEITSYNPAIGTYNTGNVVSSRLMFENTGNVRHTFYIGCTYTDVNGDPYHMSSIEITLDPGVTSGWVTMSWTVPAVPVESWYDITVAILETNPDTDSSAISLDSLSSSDSFYIDIPDLFGFVTLSFDDGSEDQYYNGWMELKKRGMKGVFNIVTTWLDTNWYIKTWQLLEMQSDGCEIASHSHTHRYFETLSEAEIRYECETSKNILESKGLVVTDFVYPGGSGNESIDVIVAEYYRTGRYGWGYMTMPYTNFHIYGGTSYSSTDKEDVDNYKGVIDLVASTGEWVLLYFHSIPDIQTSDEEISVTAFAEVLDYIITKGVRVITMSEAQNIDWS